MPYRFKPGRGGYIYVIDGDIQVNYEHTEERDAARVTGSGVVNIEPSQPTELLTVSESCGPLREGEVQRQLFVGAHDAEAQYVARMMSVDRAGKVGVARQGLAIDLDDHVTRLAAAGEPCATWTTTAPLVAWVPSWAAMAGLSATKLIPRNGCTACPEAMS